MRRKQMFARLAVDASDRDRIGESWTEVTSSSFRFTWACVKKKMGMHENCQKIEFPTKERNFRGILLTGIKRFIPGQRNFFGM